MNVDCKQREHVCEAAMISYPELHCHAQFELRFTVFEVYELSVGLFEQGVCVHPVAVEPPFADQ